MSLDVSPDGMTIVFDLLGDLYTLSIEGGKARRLTSGMAFNQQPRYSPDGRHLAFVSDQSGSANLWIADSDGRHARQLSNLNGAPYGAVSSPVWSPDGRTIVVSQVVDATRPGRVAMSQAFRWLLADYKVETGRMGWISDTAPDRARSALGAVFRPDGRAVYAAVDGFRKDFFTEPEDWRIVQVDLTTRHIQPMGPKRAGRAGMRPAMSRDGRFLVYATSSGSRFGLRLRDLRTDHERWLVREVLDNPPLFPTFDSRDLMPGYAFTPDSRSVVVAYGGQIHRINLVTQQSRTIPFVAEVVRGLGPLSMHRFPLPDTATDTRSVMHPMLSPDGRWVAFSALDRIWLMELLRGGRAAGRPYRLTADSIGEFYPSWSPDGRWIAYSTWVDGEGGAVRRTMVGKAGDKPAASQRLTRDAGLYFHTAVSPKGERVVAVRAALPPERLLTLKTSAQPTLVWVPTEGGSPRTVTSLVTEQHRWSHERYPVDQLYFTTDRDRIFVGFTSWRWDGTDRRVVLTVSGREDSFRTYEAAGVFSPDKRRALVTRRHTLFELGLPTPRADAPTILNIERLRAEPFGAVRGTANRWGTVLAPWISWSRDGRRVLFSQGGTLLVGNVSPGNWIVFARVDVPLRVRVDVPRGILILHGARLITMRDREVIERGDLLIQGNRIVDVGPVGRVAIPHGARVIDLNGKTILPGYTDLHDHMYLPTGLHPGQCWQCLTMLSYGVTAGRDPQPMHAADVFAYRERERTGDLLGPRIFSTGIAYNATDPPIQSLKDARDAVHPNADYFGSETFKVFHDPSTGRRARQLLAVAAAERRVNATVEGGPNAAIDLTVVMDGFSGLEHAPPIRIYDDVAGLVAQSGTVHTQTYGVLTGYQYMLHRFGGLWGVAKMRRFAPPSARESTCDWCADYVGSPELSNLVSFVSGAARIAAKGGQVGIGSHGEIPGIGYHFEMWLHALGGMPSTDILRSATLIGAKAIGHDDDFGSLAPGKLADLQVLDKNPLDNIRYTASIRYVMKNGRLYKADDLMEIWPRQRELAPIYLWK